MEIIFTSDEAQPYAAALRAARLPEDWSITVALRPNRRTLGLTVEPGGEILIAVPPQATPERVATSMQAHLGELVTRVERARRLALTYPVKRLVNGELFELLGRRYRLHVTDTRATRIVEHATGGDGVLFVGRGSPKTMRAAIVALYCTRGVEWMQEHGRPYEAGGLIRPGLTYAADSLGKLRWGTYAPSLHRVRLHWVAFGLPTELTEHVLVHELAHATRPAGESHSRGWQRQMGLWMPDWRQRQDALAEAAVDLWFGHVAGPSPD